MSLSCAVLAAALTLSAPAIDNPEKEPSAGTRGKVYAWHAADGLPFEYFVPKDYDPEVGANLTLVLHGNGLDHRWTFWNHRPGEFRSDDIVVSPDGTTPYGSSNEFLGNAKDVERFHALLEELRTIWNVRQVFLYGHSQGSFFVFHYAGEHPDDVDGVLGHASGVWSHSKLSRKGHHLAIALMHGTDDGNVPYGQSLWGRKVFREAGYPLVHLRTLFDWPHAPHQLQAERALAWCEGTTSRDPERVEACLELLADARVAQGADWSALHAVARRMADMEQASEKQRERGRAIRAAVEELATSHAEAIRAALGKRGRLEKLGTGEHVGLLIRFLEEFDGIPAREELVESNRKAIEGLARAGEKAFGDFQKHREKKPPKAFAAGLELLEGGFLHHRVPMVVEAMEEWARDAKKLRIGGKALKAFKALSKAYGKGRRKGFQAFEARNARVTKL